MSTISEEQLKEFLESLARARNDYILVQTQYPQRIPHIQDGGIISGLELAYEMLADYAGGLGITGLPSL